MVKCAAAEHIGHKQTDQCETVCLVKFKKKIYIVNFWFLVLAVDLHWQESSIDRDTRLEIPCIFFCFSSRAGEILIRFSGSYSW